MYFAYLRWFSCLALIFFVQGGEAAGSKALFQRHLNPVFIESGSFFGDGIEAALQAGFKEVYSIELSPHLHEHCKNRFLSNPHVHLYEGDSAVVLKEILNQLDDRATFWLDGHYSEGITAKGKTHSPILQELEQIAAHPIKSHTILIDDIRLLGTVHFDFVNKDEIIAAIKKINPNYKITYENGKDDPNDVLIAEI